jgi:hypothetical protein
VRCNLPYKKVALRGHGIACFVGDTPSGSRSSHRKSLWRLALGYWVILRTNRTVPPDRLIS